MDVRDLTNTRYCGRLQGETLNMDIRIADIVDFILKHKVLSPEGYFFGDVTLKFFNGELTLYKVESTHKPEERR